MASARRKQPERRRSRCPRHEPAPSAAPPDDARVVVPENQNVPGDTGPVLRAVELAAQELNQSDLAALNDPGYRSQASKWRTGDGSRRVSAVLARMLNALHTIRPQWLAGMAEDHGEPPEVAPLPFRPGVPKGVQSVPWARNISWKLYRVLVQHWRTVAAILLLLCFPKLVSALVAVFVRLVLRFVIAIFARLCQELWNELEAVWGHFSLMSSRAEDALVHHLEMVMSGWSSPVVTSRLVDDRSPSSPQTPPQVEPPRPEAFPHPPSQLFTNLLLVCNLLVQLRAATGVGWADEFSNIL